MQMKNSYLCVGIMTGNSLDAVDVVLTKFENNLIEDVCGYTKDIPQNIANGFRLLKNKLSDNGGDIEQIYTDEKDFFTDIHNQYISLIAEAINEMSEQYHINKKDIDAIGFHGQTCYHLPPSVAKNESDVNTLQIGSGQMLSDLTEIPVVFDFRSDDIMNGGEGAPLAPVHNQHLAMDLQQKGVFPVVFCNGGNTGNIAIIYEDKVVGWDVGPFNHFVDELVRNEKNENCDYDGKYGSKGKVDYNLLEKLFEESVLTQDGDNFLLRMPPKSSDPAWYNFAETNIVFEDKVRTAEFFSAYIMVYGLKYSPVKTPDYFLVFGGGWNNPIIRKDFERLLKGQAEVLSQHKDIFADIQNEKVKVKWSDEFGYNGKYMEARIFADMAKCKLTNEPFSFPATSGCKSPTVGGVVVYPKGDNAQLWSRAAKGWINK